jgi:mono/diheme cytochrome c family protein
MGKFLLGVVITLILIVVVGYGYFALGMAPAATAASPMPLEKRLAKMALRARIKKEMPNGAAMPASEANLLAGAEMYKNECAVCHGLPGGKKTNIAAGMFPKPPQLFEHGVTDDPVGETYWKVANGIRLTGMPAFKASTSDEAVWQVSLLLANADKLPPSVTAALSQAVPAATPGVPPPTDTQNLPSTKK